MVAFLVACGEDRPAPSAAPVHETPEPTSETSADPVPSPAPGVEPTVERAAAPDPVPTAEEIAAARLRCREVWARYLEEGLRVADDLGPTLEVLSRAVTPQARRTLGACAYNAGRMAEDALDLAAARAHYDASLEARPNPVVRRRRARLGQRELRSDPSHATNIAAQLRRADGSPCNSRGCSVRVIDSARTGAGVLRRAVLVRVFDHDAQRDEDVLRAIHVAVAGPSGPYRWGPAVWRAPQGPEIVDSQASAEIAFVPIRDGADWDLVVRSHAEVSEACCGWAAEHNPHVLTVCQVAASTRCVSMVEGYNEVGDPVNDDTDDDPIDRHEWIRVVLTSDGVDVPAIVDPGLLRDSYPSIVEGDRTWAQLFPEPAPPDGASESP